MKNNDKLQKWQGRFERAKTSYEGVLAQMEDRQRQYRGDHKIRNASKDDEVQSTSHVWNITAENIDSEIDSVIPPAKVTALYQQDEALAKKIEQMLKAQMDRMPVEELNDICERTVKVQGGVIFLPEWDEGKRTHTSVGEVVLSHVHPKQFIPQAGVSNIDDMDYYFLMLPQTKESIRRKYGVSVHDEAEEFPEVRSFDAETAEDMVTMILAHYRNDEGFVGLFGWVGDTVVIDCEDYLARQQKRCKKCGQLQDGSEVALERPVQKDGSFPQGSRRRKKDGTCAYCGGKLENVPKDAVRVHLSELRLIGVPDHIAASLSNAVRPKDGEYLPPMMIGNEMGRFEGVLAEQPPTASLSGGVPAWGASGMPRATGFEGVPAWGASGMPRATGFEGVPAWGIGMQAEDPIVEIPFFKPESYPAVLQRNITTFGEFLGESDCDKIADQQNTINRISHKIIGRVLEAGSVVGLPSDTTFTTDSSDRKQWRFKTAEEIQFVRQFDFTGDISPHLAVMSQVYEESRRVLGITDSFQGRRDTTATSGRAKEFAAAQSAGRLESKKVLKAACWQRIYKRIFELMLAYCDDRRPMVIKGADGGNVYGEWNKWEFLKVDEAGEIYWNTDFLFSTDDASALAQNRMALWQETTGHLASGAFGNPGDIQTLITFWHAMAANHYPGAETIAQQLEERAAEQAQIAAMQAVQQPAVPGMPM